MINREKAARLLMVWREVQSGGKLRVQDTANITGINYISDYEIFFNSSVLFLSGYRIQLILQVLTIYLIMRYSSTLQFYFS